MAARWRGKDGHLNAGNSDFLASNTPNELVLGGRGVDMDTQSCMDHSILAIFEDSAVASEDKSRADEESESLLSALTEMLDSVEDVDGTLSPFDTLPDTQLLTRPERRDQSAKLADRLRPRSKPPNVPFTIRIDGEKEDESKMERSSPPQLFKQQTLFHSKNKKAEAEVEVFTSTSLVNLVKLMHPYCLKLHVEEEEEEEGEEEEEDKPRKNHTLFAQEEVWKYERPSEESDEEINVVSDDEVTVKDTKGEEEGDEKRDNDGLLKGVLLNGNSSRTPSPREKKRVSFGPVQVVSWFDESAEKGLKEKNRTSGRTGETPVDGTKALENPAGSSALEPQTASSEMNEAEVQPLKGETKAKSLSLQQYRQLRQKRRPLAEKRGNYTTKWPCVSEAPKELTPILCLQGQRQTSGPKAAHHYPVGNKSGADQLHASPRCPSAPPRLHPSDPKPHTHLRRSGLKRPRTESTITSAVGLQPDVAANPNIPESKTSPAKKPTPVSSDPPNPVLVPLPVRTAASADRSSPESKVEFLSTDSNPDSTGHFTEIQNESSGTSVQRQPSSSGPKPEAVSVELGCSALFQESKNGFTERPPALCATSRQIKSSAEREKPQPQRCSTNETTETQREPKTPPSPRPDTATTADSGIEAPDLTSLLEQFEETQAKEESSEVPKLAASPSNLQADGHVDGTVGTQRSSVEAPEPLSTSQSPDTPATLANSPHLRASEGADIPEPLGTEIVLGTRQDLPARRKTPPSKAIQIIDPRPLPSKKTHASLPELPAAQASPRAYSSVSSDHDYCGFVDRSLPSAAQRGRAAKPKDASKTSESQVAARDSSAECRKQTSAAAAAGAVDTAAAQHLSETPRSRSETSPASTDKVLSDCGGAAEDEAAPCSPPSPPARGRERRSYRRRSPRSDSGSSSRSSSSSSSSSASPSPKRQKHRHKRSESSSYSSSPSSSRSVSRSPPRRHSWSYSRSRCSRSRSRSWSQSRSPSRSRSPSPRVCRRRWRDVCSRESRKLQREREIRIQKLKAIDERRVVYVGRIRKSMTHDELRERFSQFGDVECVSLHFRDRGDHYGFVTFYNMDDAFAAIDNGGKLRKPDELPFDICFGGRRQFCSSDYADLDANRDAEPSPARSRFEDLDFDSLLKQAQRGLKR